MKKFWINVKYNEANETWEPISTDRKVHWSLEEAKKEASSYIINSMSGNEVAIMECGDSASLNAEPVKFDKVTADKA